jgi:hypothetical protein
MSPKGKKATAPKASKERSPVLTTGRTPLRSPIDDGARSQMFDLSSDLSNSRTCPARRSSGGTEPLVSLDLDPPRKKRKQKEPLNTEDSSEPSLHGPCDPNLGIGLEEAVETRAQQAQNRARNEQTPLKERFDPSDSAIEGQDSSSASNNIAIESQDSSSAADKSAMESPDSSSAFGSRNEGLPQGEKSNQSLPPKPFSSNSSDVSEEEVNADKEDAIDSSLNRADYASIRAEINSAFSSRPQNDTIVQEPSSSANNAETRYISVANLFLSQSKENTPTASPLRERNGKSPVEHIDPKEVPADPRFVFTQDILDAIDVSQETEEETMPESLLHGHFKVLYEKGHLNTIEEVKAAYMRVLQTEDCNVSEDFLYDITLQLYQSADPFGTAAHNFTIAQKLMIDEQRTHFRESMRKLQIEQKKMPQDHLQLVSKRMSETCEAKDKELIAIKAELRRLNIAHTLLVNQHAV